MMLVHFRATHFGAPNSASPRLIFLTKVFDEVMIATREAQYHMAISCITCRIFPGRTERMM